MRNPRRIVLSDEVIAKYNLCTDPPPQNSLFWELWGACGGLAAQALQSQFIQGISNGNLDPVLYGGFNVNDAYYCFEGAPDYLAASNRAVDESLKQFLTQKYNSYETYNATFPQIWHVKDITSIVPFPVCAAYAAFEAQIATDHEFDPIYSLIVMLPCEYLWPWLASQIPPPSPQNLYAFWVTDNSGFDGPYAMGNFLDYYQSVYPNVIDPGIALKFYMQAMLFEVENFQAAVPTDK